MRETVHWRQNNLKTVGINWGVCGGNLMLVCAREVEDESKK